MNEKACLKVSKIADNREMSDDESAINHNDQHAHLDQ